jgi:DNA-binding beta-propeller fold protein YncE
MAAAVRALPIAALALATACGALGAEPREVRLAGPRSAVAGTTWRATLAVRPEPRALPRVEATHGSATTAVRVRRAGAGRYALTASFRRAGRWQLRARVGDGRHALGAVAVSAAPIRLTSVLGIALHPDGGLLIADGDSSRVVRVDLRTGRLTPFASAGLVAPTGLAAARDGTVYVADRHARAVFRVRNGSVTRLAEYGDPLTVAVDSEGTVFAAGRENTVVRIDPATGSVTRYAGTGEDASRGNGGPALAASIAAPHGLAVDPNDNVVVAEVTSVRRIDRTTRVIDGIAGSGERRLCTEQAPAREVCLTALRVAFAPGGDFFVADPENRRLWHVAGGRARAFDLGFPPFDVAVESATTVLVADNAGRRVLRYDLATGAITKVAG